jgi:hypothetical protein
VVQASDDASHPSPFRGAEEWVHADRFAVVECADTLRRVAHTSNATANRQMAVSPHLDAECVLRPDQAVDECPEPWDLRCEFALRCIRSWKSEESVRATRR